jgi:AhpD family alkylhydroperoxidase
MSEFLVRTALRRSLSQIRYVSPVRAGQTTELVAQVYQRLEYDFGMLAPPVALHSPAPQALAACWTMLRETLVVPGEVDRSTREAIATAVSLSNACPYCVDVHAMTLEALGRQEAEDPEDDQRIRRIADWARASAGIDTATLYGTPFPAAHTAELVGIVVAFHYINRMVNVFLPETPLPPGVPRPVRGHALRFLGRFIRSAVRRDHAPGASLDLLPPAPLPKDLNWSRGNHYVAEAFARAAGAIDTGAARMVSDPVRSLVLHRLTDWSGDQLGISPSWADDAVSGLPAADRATGKLALLTAMASFQVDRTVVEQFRQSYPDDRSLIELTSWASLAAARRIGKWIPAGGAHVPDDAAGQ